MGGWFRKEISKVSDLQGLKMQIPGLGGKVMSKLGATVQTPTGRRDFPGIADGGDRRGGVGGSL